MSALEKPNVERRVPCQNAYAKEERCPNLVIFEGLSVYCADCDAKNYGRKLPTASAP